MDSDARRRDGAVLFGVHMFAGVCGLTGLVWAMVAAFVVFPSVCESERGRFYEYGTHAGEECDETLFGNGARYRGCQHETRNGIQCQRWTVQSPQQHSNTPENRPRSGLGDHALCRNPDGDSSIWCYQVSGARWDFCDPLPGVDDSIVRCFNGEEGPLRWSRYMVTDWGGRDCLDGAELLGQQECQRALEAYDLACPGSNDVRAVDDEAWDGPRGCHVHARSAAGISFQFNPWSVDGARAGVRNGKVCRTSTSAIQEVGHASDVCRQGPLGMFWKTVSGVERAEYIVQDWEEELCSEGELVTSLDECQIALDTYSAACPEDAPQHLEIRETPLDARSCRVQRAGDSPDTYLPAEFTFGTTEGDEEAVERSSPVCWRELPQLSPEPTEAELWDVYPRATWAVDGYGRPMRDEQAGRAGRWYSGSRGILLRFVCEQMAENTSEAANGSQGVFAGCGTGWRGFGASCYLRNATLLEFGNAEAACASLGASLVSITSAEEQRFLEAFIGRWSCWLGLSELTGTEEWQWSDGTSLGSFGAWQSFSNWDVNASEPNNWHGVDDDVAFINHWRFLGLPQPGRADSTAHENLEAHEPLGGEVRFHGPPPHRGQGEPGEGEDDGLGGTQFFTVCWGLFKIGVPAGLLHFTRSAIRLRSADAAQCMCVCDSCCSCYLGCEALLMLIVVGSAQPPTVPCSIGPSSAMYAFLAIAASLQSVLCGWAACSAQTVHVELRQETGRLSSTQIVVQPSSPSTTVVGHPVGLPPAIGLPSGPGGVVAGWVPAAPTPSGKTI